MKTIHKVLITIGIITALAVAAVGGYLGYQYYQYTQKLFLNNSTLNGVDVSCMSVDGAYNTIYEDSQNKKLILTAGSEELVTLNVSDFCDITVDKDAIQAGMDEISFSDFLQGKSRNYEAECSAVIDSEQAKECLKESLSQVEQIKSKNARIEKTKDTFALTEETYGTEINKKQLLKEIENTIEDIAKNQITSIDVTQFYKQPSVKSDDLTEDYEKIQNYLDWSVTYKNSNVTITGKDLFQHMTYNNKKHKIVIDDSFLKDKVSKLAKSLNTVGKTRTFKATSYRKSSKKAHSGKKIKVSGGTYGQTVNTQAEYEKLSQFLKKGKSKQDREPEWLFKVKGNTDDDIGDTYIEISIDRQHLWYYVKGKLKMETDIVTGTKGLHDTPTGVYYITERINGKYLTGATYRTWVNKWMRLTNMGIGLHDATWRRSFGGSIYTSSGSHGCINLPYSFACNLYDAVYVGLPVVVYDEG